MILRRLCSAIQLRRPASTFSASSSSSQSRKPDVSTRGRLKPLRGVSVTTRLSAARLSRATADERGNDGLGLRETKGRRKPSRLDSDSTITQHPENERYSFKPVRLHPAQMALHLALNPPHMPLPVHLGTTHYQSASAPVSSSVPFAKPPIPSLPAQLASMETPTSGFREHLNVLEALPSDLATPPPHRSPSSSSPSHNDFPVDLTRSLGEAGVRNRVTSEYDWHRILTHLGDKPSPTAASRSDKWDIDAAVTSLQTLLARLQTSRRGRSRTIMVVGPDGEEEWVKLDSTQRKRRKKITKHKYKKRRKVGRAVLKLC